MRGPAVAILLLFVVAGCASFSGKDAGFVLSDEEVPVQTFEQVNFHKGENLEPSGRTVITPKFDLKFLVPLSFDVSSVSFDVILRSLLREVPDLEIRWSGSLSGIFSGRWNIHTYSDLVELLETIARYSGHKLEYRSEMSFAFLPLTEEEFTGGALYRGAVGVSQDVVDLVSEIYGVSCNLHVGIVTCFGDAIQINGLSGVWDNFSKSVVAGWKIVPTGDVNWLGLAESLGLENVIAVVDRGDGYTVISSAVDGAVDSLIRFGSSQASEGCAEGFIDPRIDPSDLISFLEAYVDPVSWCKAPVLLGKGVAWSILGSAVQTLERVLVWAQKDRPRAYGLAVVVDRKSNISLDISTDSSIFRWASGKPAVSESFMKDSTYNVRHLGAALNDGVMSVGVSSERFVSGDIAQGVGGQVVGTRAVGSGFRVSWDGRSHADGWSGSVTFNDTSFDVSGGTGGSSCGPVDVNLSWGEEMLVCSVYAKTAERTFSLRNFGFNRSKTFYDVYIALGGGMVSDLFEQKKETRLGSR